MATQKIVLGPLNNFTLASGTQYNFVAGGPGHYFINFLNRSNADMAVSYASTVALTDPASYIIPSGTASATDVGYNVSIWGPTGVWVVGTGAISVALVPKG